LIGFAGLAPGVEQSDRTRRDGHIGGGGTDKHLRHYVIEATIWARELPRYKATYQRIAQRKGPRGGETNESCPLSRVESALRQVPNFQVDPRGGPRSPHSGRQRTRLPQNRPPRFPNHHRAGAESGVGPAIEG
jgi:hypothetical protein